jgi:oligopeptide transport system ATP-binding protein
MDSVLEVTDLKTYFDTNEGVVRAVNGVSLNVKNGEMLCVVGESGCGKSVTMRSVLRLVPNPPGRIVSGSARFHDVDLLRVEEQELRRIRGRDIGVIFQDPMTSLNPVLTVGRQIGEVVEEHLGLTRRQARERAVELLKLVGIPNAEHRVDEYPHQFSGGMRQRAMIAMALACDPSLLIADEPTTALDVTIQLQILNLVKRLQNELGMAVIWITHDLGVVAKLAHRVIVMYAGYIVEEASVADLFTDPRHPYTEGLLKSLPGLNEDSDTRLQVIPGQPPDQLNLGTGCPFADRCVYRVEKCAENPPLELVAEGHRTACWEQDKVGKV